MASTAATVFSLRLPEGGLTACMAQRYTSFVLNDSLKKGKEEQTTIYATFSSDEMQQLETHGAIVAPLDNNSSVSSSTLKHQVRVFSTLNAAKMVSKILESFAASNNLFFAESEICEDDAASSQLQQIFQEGFMRAVQSAEPWVCVGSPAATAAGGLLVRMELSDVQESNAERELADAVNGIYGGGSPSVQITPRERPFALLEFEYADLEEVLLKIHHGTANIRPFLRQPHWQQSLAHGNRVVDLRSETLTGVDLSSQASFRTCPVLAIGMTMQGVRGFVMRKFENDSIFLPAAVDQGVSAQLKRSKIGRGQNCAESRLYFALRTGVGEIRITADVVAEFTLTALGAPALHPSIASDRDRSEDRKLLSAVERHVHFLGASVSVRAGPKPASERTNLAVSSNAVPVQKADRKGEGKTADTVAKKVRRPGPAAPRARKPPQPETAKPLAPEPVSGAELTNNNLDGIPKGYFERRSGGEKLFVGTPEQQPIRIIALPAIAISPRTRNPTGKFEKNEPKEKRPAGPSSDSDGMGIVKRRRLMAELDEEETHLLSQDSTVSDPFEKENKAPLRQKAKATRIITAPGSTKAVATASAMDMDTDPGIMIEESVAPFSGLDGTVPFADLDAAVAEFQIAIANRSASRLERKDSRLQTETPQLPHAFQEDAGVPEVDGTIIEKGDEESDALVLTALKLNTPELVTIRAIRAFVKRRGLKIRLNGQPEIKANLFKAAVAAV